MVPDLVDTWHGGMVTGLQFTQNWIVGKVLAQCYVIKTQENLGVFCVFRSQSHRAFKQMLVRHFFSSHVLLDTCYAIYLQPLKYTTDKKNQTKGKANLY